MTFSTVKSSVEARFVLVMLALLVALAVPASAAAFGGAVEKPVVQTASGTAHAASLPLLQNAPPPLMIMLAGMLIVAATVTRRLRKSAIARAMRPETLRAEGVRAGSVSASRRDRAVAR